MRLKKRLFISFANLNHIEKKSFDCRLWILKSKKERGAVHSVNSS